MLQKVLVVKFCFTLLINCLLCAFSHIAIAGLKVEGNSVLDPQGKAFLIRGMNITHAWRPKGTEAAINAAASFGVNTIRVVLSSGHIWRKNTKTEIQNIIQQAKSLGLVTILEVHDTTGYGNKEMAVSIANIMPYWLSLVGVLQGTEDYVMINIGNEPVSGTTDLANWKQPHIAGINMLRKAGLKHVVVVDALGYGQDYRRVMVKHATDILHTDPIANVMFSVHMYQVYPSETKVKQYFEDFKKIKLPLIVGEFGDEHQGDPVDEDAIINLAVEYQVGLLAWSWSGNNKENQHLDLAIGGDPDNLSSWGKRFLLGTNGVCETSQPISALQAKWVQQNKIKNRCQR